MSRLRLTSHPPTLAATLYYFHIFGSKVFPVGFYDAKNWDCEWGKRAQRAFFWEKQTILQAKRASPWRRVNKIASEASKTSPPQELAKFGAQRQFFAS